MGVLPPSGAGHPLPGHILRKVRSVGWVLKKFTVAQAGAVHPGDGEVEVSLPGEVAEEEGGGQKLRVGLTVVRVRDKSVKNVAKQIQHDSEVREPTEDDYNSVVASIASGVRENLRLIIHLKRSVCCNRWFTAAAGHCAQRAVSGVARGQQEEEAVWIKHHVGV